MIRTRALLLVLCIGVFAFAIEKRLTVLRSESVQSDMTIALAYNPDENSASAVSSREAYTEVLKEEGIPAVWISEEDLFLLDTKVMTKRFRAILFPDGLNENVSEELSDLMRKYAQEGGHVAVIYDAGSRDRKNAFIERGSFSPLIGIDYGGFLLSHPPRPVFASTIKFTSPEAASFWGFPLSKIDGTATLVGYHYGRLLYPRFRAQVESAYPLPQVSAGDSDNVVFSMRTVGQGDAVWVNLPLGYLKAHGDDLPLRTVMRTVVRRFARMPYLVPVPWGVGTAVITWHVDSSIERFGIPNLFKNDLIRPDMHMEFDVTAGPDRDYPGDGLGLDACGDGRPFVRLLAAYGTIGSHGGWMHNWFADQLSNGKLSEPQVEQLTLENNRCLESVTGKKVLSYAAPAGVHPQPMMTRILERLGVTSYYYTGDSGSPPNRTFDDGHMVSSSVWAYPVTSYLEYASFHEMRAAGVSSGIMNRYLKGAVQYAQDEHTAVVLYSHPYDLLENSYAKAYGDFLKYAETRQRQGALQTASMPDFTAFSQRFIETTLSLRYAPRGWLAVIVNPLGLNAVSFALPSWLVISPDQSLHDVRITGRTPDYTLYAITSNFRVPLIFQAAMASISAFSVPCRCVMNFVKA